MLAFRIDDMTCGHCVRNIAEAVRTVDAAARVDADLARREVAIDSRAGEDAVGAAIRAAGYAPVRIDAAGASGAATASTHCCGGDPARGGR